MHSFFYIITARKRNVSILNFPSYLNSLTILCIQFSCVTGSNKVLSALYWKLWQANIYMQYQYHIQPSLSSTEALHSFHSLCTWTEAACKIQRMKASCSLFRRREFLSGVFKLFSNFSSKLFSNARRANGNFKTISRGLSAAAAGRCDINCGDTVFLHTY